MLENEKLEAFKKSHAEHTRVDTSSCDNNLLSIAPLTSPSPHPILKHVDDLVESELISTTVDSHDGNLQSSPAPLSSDPPTTYTNETVHENPQELQAKLNLLESQCAAFEQKYNDISAQHERDLTSMTQRNVEFLSQIDVLHGDLEAAKVELEQKTKELQTLTDRPIAAPSKSSAPPQDAIAADHPLHLELKNVKLKSAEQVEQMSRKTAAMEKEFKLSLDRKDHELHNGLEKAERELKSQLDLKEKDFKKREEAKLRADKDATKLLQKQIDDKEKELRANLAASKLADETQIKQRDELASKLADAIKQLHTLQISTEDLLQANAKLTLSSSQLQPQLTTFTSQCQTLTAELDVSRSSQERLSKLFQEGEQTNKKVFCSPLAFISS